MILTSLRRSALVNLFQDESSVLVIFFIAGLLYLLRFKRVDNLGAYSIPSETGLLIPSDYGS